jgi:ribitol-5-phosphate 2-dehydrogenase
MISHTYRLYSPKQIRMDQIDEQLGEDSIIVRPTYLSICASDQRYYNGKRDTKAMKEKLPMALIHEAVGEVVFDPKNIIKKGTKVVMIPNTPIEEDKVIKENYLKSSKFKSSGYDGFMRNIVLIDRNRVIEYSGFSDKVASFLEVLSVAMNAIEHFENYSHSKRDVFGVWGDGNVGFITSLILKYRFPNAKIIVLGKNPHKLEYFQFVDKIYEIDQIPDNFCVDHAFECVGSYNAEDAINQIIDYINPEGSILLMGVSERNIAINTRMILEKGLRIIGNSRSGYNDFFEAIKFIKDNKGVEKYLKTIISDLIIIRGINDIHAAFERDLTNDFKTVMKWEI